MDDHKQPTREKPTSHRRARLSVTLRSLSIGLAALAMIFFGLLWAWRADRVQHESPRPGLAEEDIGDRLG